MGAPLGEGFIPSSHDVGLDAAEEAYLCAAEVAEELGDDLSLAAASRELGVIDLGRVRAWFVERVLAGEHWPMMARVSAGEPLDAVLAGTPAMPFAGRAGQRFDRALALYEKGGDRRGAMSTIIAMAYLNWAPDIHMGTGAARHIEEIRRLSSRLHGMAKESERALEEAQMVYGAHVFARAKIIPDLAITRGEEAHRQARVIGERSLEFVAAGGTALAHMDLGEVEAAERWLDRAAAAAAESPTPLRARQLETWRGMARAVAGDADGMRRHLERAKQLATEQGSPAGRCEILARLALEASRLGAERQDQDLLARAERSAAEAKAEIGLLTGHPPWGAQAEAALARVALARGGLDDAVGAARSAVAELESAMHEDPYPELVLPVAEAFLAGGEEGERQMVSFQIRTLLGMVALRTLDDDLRARWFRGPVGRPLTLLAGTADATPAHDGNGSATPLNEGDTGLLRLILEARTNREIAAELGVEEPEVTRRLGELFASIGASSRAEATAFAFRERVV